MESKKRLHSGWSFAAGTLVGAIAAFVPLASAGHPGPNVDRSVAVVQSEAPRAASPAPASAQSKASRESQESNTAGCDVQLD